MEIYSHTDYLDSPFLAVSAIGAYLRAGSLNLFLGAGVSKGFGLPAWTELVARIVGKEDNMEYMARLGSMSDNELSREVDACDNGNGTYANAVHQALYKTVAPTLLDQLSSSPLLLAVTALLTGTRRGRVQTVFTYNYDDLLEQYLRLLGYSLCVRNSPSDYSTHADAEINHVHGYLPQHEGEVPMSEDVVLSAKSYRRRRAAIDQGWSAAVEASLFSRVGLFLGLSASDSSMFDILARAKSKIERGEEYHGYWLLTSEAYAQNASDVLDVGMCPIRLDKEELPRFVFEVCQEAALVPK